MTVRIITGDCREQLRLLPDESVHCVVTSPPYWGLRDYGVAGQIGLEEFLGDYVSNMVEVFREVRRVLRGDGTAWINLGDCYNAARNGGHAGGAKQASLERHKGIERSGANVPGLKAKDLCGMPWRVAFALQADGWYLRQDIIWSKPNPMPESVRDRCTKAHDYIFLLSKSERYYYDQDAIREPLAEKTFTAFGCEHRPQGNDALGKVKSDNWGKSLEVRKPKRAADGTIAGANKRSVWEIATAPYSEAHFATFPPALVEPCIKAGCSEKVCAKCGAPWVRKTEHIAGDNEATERPKRTAGMSSSTSTLSLSGGSVEWAKRGGKRITFGFLPSCSCNWEYTTARGTVLDPFGGAGTTGLVADRLGRNAILIELNPEYAAMAERRIRGDAGMFANVDYDARKDTEAYLSGIVS